MPQTRPGPLRALYRLLLAAPKNLGGQAVMEGVMMRNGEYLAVAVRKTDGEIDVATWPWFSLTRRPWLKKPFIRGFPVLLETLVNGIKALNHSAAQAVDEEVDGELKPWHIALTLVFAIGLALGLFVVVPHLMSLGMKQLGLGGGAEGLTFHLWDGFFKLAIFLGYIYAISLLPAIKRVFAYHGAEHKVIWTYEETKSIDLEKAKGFSRLHPRCGTAFLLFVLSISIVLHAVLVPLLLLLYTPENAVLKHVFIVTVKLGLMVPIACLGYEAIRLAGRYCNTLWGKLMSGPGLLLQRLTTSEPDEGMLEVAAAALTSALAAETDAADLSRAETVEPTLPGADPGSGPGVEAA